MDYWQKYAPIVAKMIANQEINASALDFKNRFKMYLFCRQKFGLLKIITGI